MLPKAVIRKRTIEICSVLVRYGFRFLIKDLGLHRYLGFRQRVRYDYMKTDITAEKLRQVAKALPDMIEELGPAFIKLGQFFSSRTDVFPAFIAEALERLQENITPVDFAELELIIQENLPNYHEVVAHINPKPLGVASIAQTHIAELRDGRRVVMKIRKPQVINFIETDIIIIQNIMSFLSKQPTFSRLMDWESSFAVFAHHLKKEINFRSEAENMELFRKIFADSDSARAPEVEWSLTNENILTMEYINGLSIDDVCEMDDMDFRRTLAHNFLHSFFKQVITYGIFHGDPHPGNIRLTNEGKIIYLDFGIVGHLDPRMTELLIRCFMALDKMNVEEMMQTALDMGRPIGETNWQMFYEDLSELMFLTQTMNQGSIQLGKILYGMIKISRSNGIRLPDRLVLMGKAFALAESNARRIDPKINFMEIIRPTLEEFIITRLQPSLQKSDLLSSILNLRKKSNILFNEIPDFISGLVKGEKEIPLSIEGFNQGSKKISGALNSVAHALLLSSMFLTSGFLLSTSGSSQNTIHYAGFYLFFFASAVTAILFFKIFRQVK